MSLFPTLLGRDFANLAASVQHVHGGASRQLRGFATVERGRSVVARILCALASLPRSGTAAPVVMSIVAEPSHEEWTRRFGDSRAMKSVLSQCRGDLIERLGPAKLMFHLEPVAGGFDWHLQGISAFGMSLPRSWFEVRAHSGHREERYHFDVEAVLRGVGRIVRYQGTLDVIG